jgi:hypothetical protein
MAAVIVTRAPRVTEIDAKCAIRRKKGEEETTSIRARTRMHGIVRMRESGRKKHV